MSSNKNLEGMQIFLKKLEEKIEQRDGRQKKKKTQI